MIPLQPSTSGSSDRVTNHWAYRTPVLVSPVGDAEDLMVGLARLMK
jgi:hypothetical protein